VNLLYLQSNELCLSAFVKSLAEKEGLCTENRG